METVAQERVYAPASWRSTNGKIPPLRKYSASCGVSTRGTASKSISDPSAAIAFTFTREPLSTASRTPVMWNDLLAGQLQRCRALTLHELQRQNAHPDQVRPVNALETLRDHRAHAQQLHALGRPVARRPGTVFLARDDQERNALLLVPHRGVVDEHLFAIGQMGGPWAFCAGRKLIAQTARSPASRAPSLRGSRAARRRS